MNNQHDVAIEISSHYSLKGSNTIVRIMRMTHTLAKIEFIISKNRLLEALVCSIGAGKACLRTATVLFNQKI